MGTYTNINLMKITANRGTIWNIKLYVALT